MVGKGEGGGASAAPAALQCAPAAPRGVEHAHCYLRTGNAKDKEGVRKWHQAARCLCAACLPASAPCPCPAALTPAPPRRRPGAAPAGATAAWHRDGEAGGRWQRERLHLRGMGGGGLQAGGRKRGGHHPPGLVAAVCGAAGGACGGAAGVGGLACLHFNIPCTPAPLGRTVFQIMALPASSLSLRPPAPGHRLSCLGCASAFALAASCPPLSLVNKRVARCLLGGSAGDAVWDAVPVPQGRAGVGSRRAAGRRVEWSRPPLFSARACVSPRSPLQGRTTRHQAMDALLHGPARCSPLLRPSAGAPCRRPGSCGSTDTHTQGEEPLRCSASHPSPLLPLSAELSQWSALGSHICGGLGPWKREGNRAGGGGGGASRVGS